MGVLQPRVPFSSDQVAAAVKLCGTRRTYPSFDGGNNTGKQTRISSFHNRQNMSQGRTWFSFTALTRDGQKKQIVHIFQSIAFPGNMILLVIIRLSALGPLIAQSAESYLCARFGRLEDVLETSSDSAMNVLDVTNQHVRR